MRTLALLANCLGRQLLAALQHPPMLSCWSANHRAQAHLARLAGQLIARRALARRALTLQVDAMPQSSPSNLSPPLPAGSCPAACHFTRQHHHYIIKFAHLAAGQQRAPGMRRARFASSSPPAKSRHPLRLLNIAVLRVLAPAVGAAARARVAPRGQARHCFAKGSRAGSGEGPLPRPRVPLAHCSTAFILLLPPLTSLSASNSTPPCGHRAVRHTAHMAV